MAGSVFQVESVVVPAALERADSVAQLRMQHCPLLATFAWTQNVRYVEKCCVDYVVFSH